MWGSQEKKLGQKVNVTLSFCPKFFWESLYMWGSQEKILGHKVDEKFVRVDPGRKNPKK